jgi:hypothetical protein
MRPAITENLWQGLFADVIDTGEQLIAGVIDTGDKHLFANISANFQKKFEMGYSGAGGNCSMKKIAAENLVSDSL